MSITNVGIRFSPLTQRILLARFGRDKDTALETRDGMNEFLQVLVQYAFDGEKPAKGDAVEVRFGGGDEQFVMSLKRLETEQ